MIRATGWEVAQYRRQPVADVFDLVDHLNEEPPAHRILAWKYLKPKPRKLTESEIRSQHEQLSTELGAAPRPMPEHLKEMLRWAEEQQAKLNKNKRKK